MDETGSSDEVFDLLVLGSGGGAFGEAFQRSAEARARKDPFDRFTRRVVEAAIPEVTEFSGLGDDAMRRPMNTYSSGMRARLAFSIATLQIPDVLLIDEALAVGDRGFKRRSLERIKQIRDDAGTVLMGTHTMSEIRQTCTRCLWMNDGGLVADGEVEAVLSAYENDLASD